MILRNGMNVKSWTRQNCALAALLALGTLALYWPTHNFEFVNFDDPDYVSGNPYVRAGLTWENLRWSLTGVHSSNWHPVTWLSHMLDCQLYGLKPAGHHVSSVLLHTADVLLIFFLLNRLTRAPWRSATVAALFAWHPLHVESVAWVTERKDVLSTFFGLLCLWAYVRYVENSRSSASASNSGATGAVGGKLFYALSLVLFALGLASKPMLVPLPCLLLLLDYWPLNRFPARTPNPSAASLTRLIVEKIPYFA